MPKHHSRISIPLEGRVYLNIIPRPNNQASYLIGVENSNPKDPNISKNFRFEIAITKEEYNTLLRFKTKIKEGKTYLKIESPLEIKISPIDYN